MTDTAPQKKTLRELRDERGLSREQLAVALSVPFSTLVNLEMGRNKPRIELAERIYAYFGVPLGSIEWKPAPARIGTRKKKADSKTTPAAA